ncbi:MAG: RNA polymerase sigma factor [Deltaproteobacteria bacterium]|nr:RNA polymerase sigma factor [Deltaproteobacteria bacterium]
MTSDHDLFLAWGQGDRRAGAELIERHYPAVERFFTHKVGDRADDLVQRTFLVCAESAAGARGVGTFRGFLFGIARNVLCDHLRKKTRDGKSNPDFSESAIIDLVPGAATLVSAAADRRQLALALQRIPLDLQVLLELFYWEELSIDELAQTMGVPPGTIKSRLHRARGLLREAMERQPAPEEEMRSARTLLTRWLAEVRERDAPG